LILTLAGSFFLLEQGGCAPTSAPTASDRSTYTAQRPVAPPVESTSSATDGGAADISWDTERDHQFAEFLREKSGGMIHKAAVGIERKGLLQIELDQSVAPEDTLSLTKSVLAGARKDFPDQPIVVKVFDPRGEPILTARYRPDHGVSYQIAHGGSEPGGTHGDRGSEPSARGDRDSKNDPLARSGVTEKDRKFAVWAEEHGRDYLRYVQADLERHGRLWFGVTRDVKPADVPELTKSLLEGAMKEFPSRELTATVFDPNGERIGKAHLDSRGRVRWEQ
jgi:hypothetical protein